MNMTNIIHWFGVHWEIAWPLLTALLLPFLRSKTPEQWVALGEAHPRVQGLIKLVRALGLDPVKALSAAGQIVSGKVAAETKKLSEADQKKVEAVSTLASDLTEKKEESK